MSDVQQKGKEREIVVALMGTMFGVEELGVADGETVERFVSTHVRGFFEARMGANRVPHAIHMRRVIYGSESVPRDKVEQVKELALILRNAADTLIEGADALLEYIDRKDGPRRG